MRNGGGLDSARLASMSRTPPTSRGGASSLSLLTRPGRVGVAFQRFTNRERFCSVPGPCIDSCRDLARHARPAPPRPARPAPFRPAPFRPVFVRPPRRITSQRTPAFTVFSATPEFAVTRCSWLTGSLSITDPVTDHGHGSRHSEPRRSGEHRVSRRCRHWLPATGSGLPATGFG